MSDFETIRMNNKRENCNHKNHEQLLNGIYGVIASDGHFTYATWEWENNDITIISC